MDKKLYILFLFLLVIISYINTLKNDFIWDDKGLIFNDLSIQKGQWYKFFTFSYWKNLPLEYRGRFRPLRAVFFGLDYLIYKDKPWGYHFTNMVFHLLNTLILFILAIKLGFDNFSSFVASAIFAVHPIHTEAVSWIKNRSDLISTFFALLSFYLFISRRYLFSLLSFILSLLAKEVVMAFPLILWLYLYIKENEKNFKKYIIKIGPFMLVVVILFGLKEIFWKKEVISGLMPDAQDHFQMVLVSIGKYIQMLFFPYPLKAEHTLEPPFEWTNPYLIFGMIVLVVLFYLWLRYRENEITFYSIATVLGLLPVINIYFIFGRLIAEQRVYFASSFFCLTLGFAVSKVKDKIDNRIVVSILFIILILFSLMTYKRNFIWRDEFTFWKEAIRQSPQHYRVNYNIAILYQQNGDYEKAYEHYKKASLGLELPHLYYSLGFVCDKLGKVDEGIEAYQKCLLLGGDKNPDVYNHLGILYQKKGEIKKALEYYNKAISLKKDYLPAHYNLLEYYKNIGDYKMVKVYQQKIKELEKQK